MEGREVIGRAATDVSGHLSPYSFTLRKTGPEDVVLKVLYCGVDHTDLHQMRSEIMLINYPMVPGSWKWAYKNKFKLGDKVGVGRIISSCGACLLCNSNSEQYCSERVLTTGVVHKDGTPTHGDFASAMVVHHKFVVKIPEKLALEQAAPLLCAGVTAYSPLKEFNNSDKAIKAGIFGARRSWTFGDYFLVSSNAAEMEGAAASLDYILDTVPAVHALDPYVSLLNVGGKLILVRVVTKPLHFNTEDLVLSRGVNEPSRARILSNSTRTQKLFM
ncbi:Detected protein of confused Function [Hibiscus syriacus]|uniref:Detected protein of confused Function n=1 Tax=Hibiscus syriacus TaxID=106335 RepID=A0A6A2WKS1_HIBSY|nr:Detected protein of confused Function [Hibiscus syriacus]